MGLAPRRAEHPVTQPALHHSHHRGHRNSELAPGAHVRERVLGGWHAPHNQHGGNCFLNDVSHRWIHNIEQPGRRCRELHGRWRQLDDGLLD